MRPDSSQYSVDRDGGIDTGKLAGLISLDQQITTVDPAHIVDIEVEQTRLGGKLIFQRPEIDSASTIRH